MLAQLCGVLAAEDSAIVAKEDHRSRTLLPKGAKSNVVASGVRQDNVSESFTIGLRHVC